MSTLPIRAAFVAACAILSSAADGQTPLGSAFTYQGELRLNNIVVDEPADFVFDLYGQAAGGASLGTNARPSVTVSRGVFTVELDYGATAFEGDERWIGVRVRTPAGSGTYTTLNPRVRLTAAPHAQFALHAASADDADALGGKPASSFVLTGAPNSVTSTMIVNGTITAADLGVDVVSSLDGVTNDGGGIDLVAGPNVSITPNDGANTITIAASADGGDADTVDGLEAAQFLRADANDSIAGGAKWTVAGGSPNALTIGGGNLELNLGDSSADQVSVDGSLTTTGPNTLGDALTDLTTVNGDLDVTDALTADGDATLGDSITDSVDVAGLLTVGGATKVNGGDGLFLLADNAGGISTIFFQDQADQNLSLIRWQESDDRFLVGGGIQLIGPIRAGTSGVTTEYSAFGSSTSPNANEVSSIDDAWVTEDLAVGGALMVGTHNTGSASSTVYFTDPGFGSTLHAASHATSISWAESTPSSLSSCTAQTGGISSALVFNMEDGSSSGWAFTNGNDPEFVVDEIGVVVADSSINASGGCDLAENFLGDADLAPGTLLRADPNAAEAVVPTTTAYDPTLLGVVSTQPAFVMNGPTVDALPLIRELNETRALLATSEDLDLERRAQELEDAVDSWTRGDVAVALVGRVPVLAVGPVNVGEPLTSSDVAGHAMALRQAGPSIGIALESKSSTGRGTVLVLVQPGWRMPIVVADGDSTVAERQALAGADAVDAAVVKAVEERVLARLDARAIAARGDATERTTTARDGADGRDASPSARDVAAGAVVRLEKEAWGDFDADGRDDVLVLNPGAAARLYRNLGDGRFGDVTRPANLGATEGTRSARWHDVDGDERLDLLLVGSDGAARLLRGNGTGQFDDATAAFGLDFGEPIVAASFLDHDHDGRPDLKVELADGALLLHHNLGGMRFETVTLRSASAGAARDASDDRVAELEARLARMEALLMKSDAATEGSDR